MLEMPNLASERSSIIGKAHHYEECQRDDNGDISDCDIRG